MSTLYLSLKSEYFDAIVAGTKHHEFRVYNDYWKKRLEGRSYDKIVFTKGYPRRDDMSRRIEFPYHGYQIVPITHEHFGNNPVVVFAIHIRR